jgi:hypothetical protein
MTPAAVCDALIAGGLDEQRAVGVLNVALSGGK